MEKNLCFKGIRLSTYEGFNSLIKNIFFFKMQANDTPFVFLNSLVKVSAGVADIICLAHSCSRLKEYTTFCWFTMRSFFSFSQKLFLSFWLVKTG